MKEFISASFWHGSITHQLLVWLHLHASITQANHPAFLVGNCSTKRGCHRARGPQPLHSHLKEGSLSLQSSISALLEAPPGLQRKVQSMVCLTQTCNNSTSHNPLQPQPPATKLPLKWALLLKQSFIQPPKAIRSFLPAGPYLLSYKSLPAAQAFL